MTEKPVGALWIYADRIVFQWDFEDDGPTNRPVAGEESIDEMDPTAPTVLRLGGFTVLLIQESQDDFDRRPNIRL